MGFVGFYCSKCCQCRNFAKMNRVKVSVSISPFPCWRSQCASVTTLTQSVPGKPRLPPSLPRCLSLIAPPPQSPQERRSELNNFPQAAAGPSPAEC